MTLKATRFNGTAVTHRVVLQDDAKASLNSNLGYTGGSLLSVVVEGGVKSDCYVKIFNGNAAVVGSSKPQLIFKCVKNTTQIYQIPNGFEFTNLHMWATKNANPLDTVHPDSTTKVTLTIG
tara:strand:- start:751 stop:1113 length:363 start_codon:yes stop_codon:yes gene_type:complete